MFSFFKKTLNRIYSSVTSKLSSLFGHATIDADSARELERILLEADTGVAMTKQIMERLRDGIARGTITSGSDLKQALGMVLLASAQGIAHTPHNATIYLLVGINGSGKTTCAAKLAHAFHTEGKKVLLVAADTFRAAAPEQLAAWATKTGASLITGKPQQEPASVVFAGCQAFTQGNHDVMIIDTAGRLQTKVNLMRELEKIRRIIATKLPGTAVCTLLTVDAMLGQNSLEQARVFHESTPLDGIILTKMDGTGKGGIVFAIMHELKIPVSYMAYGETVSDFAPFNLETYIDSLLNT